MRQKALLVAFAALFTLASPAQKQDPVSWTAEYLADSATEGYVKITGTIQKGWHTYSMRPTDAGPIPTSFTLSPSSSFELAGSPTEKDAHEEFVPAFEAKIFVFHDKAEFTQKIKVKDSDSFVIPVTIEYMSCNDLMCLPPKTVTLQVKVQK